MKDLFALVKILAESLYVEHSVEGTTSDNTSTPGVVTLIVSHPNNPVKAVCSFSIMDNDGYAANIMHGGDEGFGFGIHSATIIEKSPRKFIDLCSYKIVYSLIGV
jgi:hypothetical protein